MRLNLLVIRTSDIDILKNQYELLELEFTYHRHGNGPYHYAHEENGFVFEIYPLIKSMNQADNSIRLGFTVKDLTTKIKELENSNWKILSQPVKNEWGFSAIIQDLDGRKIELKEQ